MEKRIARVNGSAAGGTAGGGAKTYKVTIPSRWIAAIGLTDTDREIELSFDGDSIILSKRCSVDEFYAKKTRRSHQLKKLLFWNGQTLCTTIVADYTDHTVCIENHTEQMVKTAFGGNKLPTWEDYVKFLEERCVPRQRDGLRAYLDALGLDEYDPMEIIRRTQGRMAEDQQWLEVVE